MSDGVTVEEQLPTFGAPHWIAALFGVVGSGTALVLYRIGLRVFRPMYTEYMRDVLKAELSTIRDDMKVEMDAVHDRLDRIRDEVRAVDSLVVGVGARTIETANKVARIEGHLEAKFYRARPKDVA